MKYNVKFEYEVNENNKTVPVTRDASHGLKIYDGQGNEYDVELNNLGELEIRANDGSLSVMPDCSNMVILKTV